MKFKLFSLISCLLIGYSGFTQQTERLHLTEQDIKPTKDTPVTLGFGLYKDDKLIISLNSEKNKPIEEVLISQGNLNLFSKKQVLPGTFEILVPETGVINFKFVGTKFGQDIHVKIEREPANADARLFNTALELSKRYDTTFIDYISDSVVGLQEPIFSPKTFRTVVSSDYESVKMHEQKYKLKGSQRKGVVFKQPEKELASPDKKMKLLGYQIIITSAAGADAMWKAISMGVEIGSMFLSPAVGIAAGTAFSMIAPQEGGEPVYFAIMSDKTQLDIFLDEKSNTQPLVFDAGLATGYSGTWMPMETFAVGLKNLNIAAEIEVSLAVYAVYQATIFAEISQNQVIVKPKTVRLNKKSKQIKNEKYWTHQP